MLVFGPKLGSLIGDITQVFVREFTRAIGTIPLI
jgi:hypothetical protein